MAEIVIKNQALEQTLAGCLEAFYWRFPQRAAAFEEYMKAEAENLVKPTGMSKNGHFLNWVKVPRILFHFIRYEMNKLHGIDDFFRDYEHYQLLMKVWKAAAVKRKISVPS